MSTATGYCGSTGPISNGFEFSKCVLIVDDSRLVRSVFASALAASYVCMCAESYEVAIAYLNAYDFDAVILNRTMLSGDQLLDRVKEEHPAMGMVIVSGDGQESISDLGAPYPAHRLPRHCDLADLQLAVRQAIDRPGRRFRTAAASH